MDIPAADDSWPALAGWFGKIPALGDFVVRRLPPHFIEAWDHWLSTEIHETRHALGPDWPSSFVNAPTWCFALTPGVLDASCWYGVLTPSVDRVGRHFPLTFAAGGEAPRGDASGGWAALIAAAVKARAADCDADALDAALVGPLQPQGARTIPVDGELTLRSAIECAGGGDTLWAAWQPECCGFGPVLTFQGLPQGQDFLKLIIPSA